MCTEKHGPVSGQERVPEWMKKHICTSRSASDTHLLTDTSFVAPECASQVHQGGGTWGKTEHQPLVLFFQGEAWKETPSCFKAWGLNSIDQVSVNFCLMHNKPSRQPGRTQRWPGLATHHERYWWKARHALAECPESGQCTVYTSGPWDAGTLLIPV